MFTAKCRLLALALLATGFLVACGDDGGAGDGPGKDVFCAVSLDCPLGQTCRSNSCIPEGSECFGDGDCVGEDMVCNGGYCDPFVPECADDDDCGDGGICDADACVPGCRLDEDCDGGDVCTEDLVCAVPPPDCPPSCPAHQACNTGNGECEPDGTCTTDTNCLPGEGCNDGVCGELIEVCDVNADCVDGMFCDQTVGLCEAGCRESNECGSIQEICVVGVCTTDAPACADDADEPNNDQMGAVQMAPGLRSDLTYCDDDDWYSFFGLTDDAITLTMDFVHDRGNLNLTLLGEDGEILRASASEDDGESFSRTLTEDGLYFVRIYGNVRDIYNDYTLDFDRTRTCREDGSEENDTLDAATAVAPGTFDSRTICGDDDDWYAVELFPGETLNASIDFLHREGDLNLELYDADEMSIDSSTSETDGEMLSYSAAVIQTVYLKVPGGADLQNRYDLVIDVMAPVCNEDSAEEDDDLATATAAVFGAANSGQICSLDSDWYSFFLTADVMATTTLQFTHADGNLAMELIRPDGTVADMVDTDTDDETLTVASDTPGLWAVRVFGPGRTQNAYTLTVDSDLNVACPADDSFEDNDVSGDAASIMPGILTNLAICAMGDEDWYAFDIVDGDSIEAFVVSAAGQGQLDLALFAPGATDPFHDVTGTGEVTRVRAQQGEAAGRWRLRVRSDDTNVLYSLRLFVRDVPLPLDCDFDDTFEDNDIFSARTDLALDQTLRAVMCEGDPADWYGIRVDAGDVVTVRLDFAHAESDLNLSLHTFADPPVQLGAFQTDTDREYFTYVVGGTGQQTLLIKVGIVSGAGAVYDLTASAVPAADTSGLACPLDDGFETNDDVSQATAMGNGVTAIHCGQNDDWFSFETGLGDDVRVNIIHDGAADGLKLELFDTSDTTFASSSTSSVAAATVDFTTLVAGTHKVRVFSTEDVNAVYTLTADVNEGVRLSCGSDDALESNESPVAGTAVDDAVVHSDLSLCGDDEDWFKVRVPVGMKVIAEASYDASEGNIELLAVDQQGVSIGSSNGTTSVEYLEIPGSDAELTAWLRASRADLAASPADYALSISYQVDGSVCTPDALEPNNTRGTASRNISTTTATLCDGDEDWFLTDAIVAYSITISFDASEADLDIEVFDASGLAGFSYGQTGTENVFILVSPDPLRARVYSADGRTTAYTVTITFSA